MSAGRPLWRRAFDRGERAVGEPLEGLVATRRFNDLLVLSFRAQAALHSLFDRQTGALLHFWNLPTRRDVRRLHREVGTLTSEVRDLAAQLGELQTRSNAEPTPERNSRATER